MQLAMRHGRAMDFSAEQGFGCWHVRILSCLQPCGLDLIRYFHQYKNMKEKDAVKKLSALAQESRLRVFRYLVVVGREGGTPSEISERLEISPATLSFHLKELMHAGLITQERVGRHLHYRAEFSEMACLLKFLTERCCQGQACEVNCPQPESNEALLIQGRE